MPHSAGLHPSPPARATATPRLRLAANTRVLCRAQSNNFLYLAHGQSPVWQSDLPYKEDPDSRVVVQRRRPGCIIPTQSRTSFRGCVETVRLPVGIGVRLQSGIAFGIRSEQRSGSPRNGVRDRPDSPGLRLCSEIELWNAVVLKLGATPATKADKT